MIFDNLVKLGVIPVTSTSAIEAKKTNVQTGGVILSRKMSDSSLSFGSLICDGSDNFFPFRYDKLCQDILTRESKHCVQSSRYTA